MTEEDFDPAEVASIIQAALAESKVLPVSFVETFIFERLTTKLSKYMSPADVTWLVGELRSEFLSGFTKLSIKQLHDITYNCRRCTNVNHPAIIPSWNCVDPDLYILVENPLSFNRYLPLLMTSLKKAGFSSQRCMLSYVTRCTAPEKADAVGISNCAPYFHTEIAIVAPKLILTLGAMPYVALTSDNMSRINDIRGSVVWFGPYAIFPEVSIAWLSHVKDNDDSQVIDFLVQSFEKARVFLYGG